MSKELHPKSGTAKLLVSQKIESDNLRVIKHLKSDKSCLPHAVSHQFLKNNNSGCEEKYIGGSEKPFLHCLRP